MELSFDDALQFVVVSEQLVFDGVVEGECDPLLNWQSADNKRFIWAEDLDFELPLGRDSHNEVILLDG